MQNLHDQFPTAELTDAQTQKVAATLRGQIVTQLTTCGWDFQEASEDVFRALLSDLRSTPDQTIGEWLTAACRRFGVSPNDCPGI